MKLSNQLHRALMASAVMALAFGSAPVLAAVSNTDFGSCVGAHGTDCVAGHGHVSVSVTDTLSVNEMRAISFGNITTSTPGTSDTIVLGLDGIRTKTGSFTLLRGVDNNGFTGSTSAGDTGSKSPGHYTISGGSEGGTTQVYVSFADTSGNVIDMCSKGTTSTTCDNYHVGNKVLLTGPGGALLAVDSFVINESGNDVYGHYIDNSGAAVGVGNPTPFTPGTAAGTGRNGGTAATAGTAGVVDVVVGATLHGLGTALTVGKYVGTFDIMASY